MDFRVRNCRKKQVQFKSHKAIIPHYILPIYM